MTTVIRHETAPRPEGCRWCGWSAGVHAQRWTAGRKWHRWERPTAEQINARMRVRRGLVAAQ